MRVPIGLSVLATAIATAAFSAQTPSNVGGVLARVGERIADYYKRVQNVICIEKTTVQPIGSSYGLDGLAVMTESELRIETEAEDGDGSGEAKVVRQIRKVNGRTPREKDKKDRIRCMEPNPLSPEPLAFLLPARRSETTFMLGGPGKGKDRDSLIIDFKSVPAGPRPELLEHSNGIEGCYEVRGSIPTRGRIWVEANTFDVLRIEEHLVGPVDYDVTERVRRRRNLSDLLTVERMDTAIRYKRVTFRDPDDVMLLPESIDHVSMYRGGIQSMRVSQTFTDYRRFVTGARLVK